MSRTALTDAYLAELARTGVGPDEVAAAAKAARDLVPTSYGGRCLTRPVFLDAAEVATIEQDLAALHAALTALPDRLFGGDLGAFARAAGMTEPQVTAILRGAGEAPTRLARADLYHDGGAFRLMELNVGSTVGGLDNAVLNEAMLAHPAVAGFVAAAGLSHVDTMAEVAGMLGRYPARDGGRPLFAAVDWPASFATLEPQLRASAAVLGALGVEVVPCHLGQLDIGGGAVRLDGRVVDVVYRVFMIEDLLDPDAPTLIDPLLRAVERGEVGMFAPMDAELYGSKAALAMLSDEANRHTLTPAERTSLDRLLPWTRMVRKEDVTAGGETVELRDYARAEREQLVLKPTLMHGGLGVVLGWTVDDAEWDRQLVAATDGPYVLQRRIAGAPEPFPAAPAGPAGPAAGGTVPTLLNWGVFTVDSGYGGAIVRGATELGGSVMNSAAGAALTCCFHAGSRS